MLKVDINDVIKYEEFKKDFYENKEVSKEEFSKVEELKYGRDLCKIYQILFNINNGRTYLKHNFIVMILSVLIFMSNLIDFNNINMYYNLYKTIIFAINISIILYSIISLLKINKYYSFILYSFNKSKKNGGKDVL